LFRQNGGEIEIASYIILTLFVQAKWWRVRNRFLYYFNPICTGKMAENKKALPKLF
jgi:hypothetical protein